MDDEPTPRSSLWRRPIVLVGAIAVVSVVVVGAWLALGDGGEPEASDPATSATDESTIDGASESSSTSSPRDSVPSTTSPRTSATANPDEDLDSETSDDPSDANVADTVEASSAQETEVPAATTTTEPPPPELPVGPISQENPSDTCEDIRERLQAYRDVVAAEPMNSLLHVQLGLEEFEHQVDFYANGADWGVAVLEELVVVRRDWSTAYAASQAEDHAEADARFQSALEHLDAAIAVPCP